MKSKDCLSWLYRNFMPNTKIEIITKVAKQIKIKRRILCVQDAN